MMQRPVCRKSGLPAAVVALALSAVLLASCTKGGPAAPPKRPPAAVTVGTVTQKTVPVQLTAIGNVEAVSTIQVKSQIGGVLQKAHFTEGQDVAKGALLFTIDPRPYEAQVKQAEANLARDSAQMDNARKDANRYEELVQKGYVAREQYEQYLTNATALAATVAADQALLDNARLQLKYCSIYSPISGRTGSLLANEGNLIKANADTAMVVINQIQPIYVTFSVPEHSLSEIKKYAAAGRLKVQAYFSKEDDAPEEGLFSFVDNAVDLSTGTIKLKGTFSNARKKLWPGQFVTAVLTLTELPGALLVPTAAIQTGQEGQYVFVVRNDNTVDSRPVSAGMTVGNETVIGKGLNPGETVVTDGQLQLVPGATVEIKNANAMAGFKPAPTAAGASR